MRSFVAITGTGLVTPLGNSAASTWDALLRGESIRDHAKVLLSDAPAVPRVIALARHAAAEAIRDATWSTQTIASDSTALIVATSKGPVEAWMEGTLEPTGLSAVAAGVASALGLGAGPRLTVSAACSSGLHALIRASMMVQAGEVQRALVVGAEASVHPLFIGSFRRLGVLPPTQYGCRPFDRERRGFLMSDAAAAVCIEHSTEPGIARVDAFAMGADATHITGSDPSGAVLRRLLEQVIASGGEINLVHGHGTGTIANDAIELNAIDDAFSGRNDRPALYSHKGAIGHSLGAAGLVSIVINCLIHREGFVPANVNLRNPLAAQNVELKSEASRRRINRSLALAAGFGGPMAVVALRSV